MENASRKPKSVDSAFLMGFSDELQKIAALGFGAAKATGLADVRKVMQTATKSSLTSKPKMVSKPVMNHPSAPPKSNTADFLSSSRMTPPPPVTVGGTL